MAISLQWLARPWRPRGRGAAQTPLARDRRLDLPTSLVGTALVLGLVALHVWNPPIVEGWRLKIFDELELRWPRTATPAIPAAVVDIDDASLTDFGQWPWPRTLLAQLALRLEALGAGAIAFDVIFAEADRHSPATYAETIAVEAPELARALRLLPDNDIVMAAALRRQKVILGIAGVPQKLAQGGPRSALPGPDVALIGEDPEAFVPAFRDLSPLVPALRDAAAGAGLVSMPADVDGIVRRVPLLAAVQGRLRPTLALEALRVLAGEESIIVRASATGVESVILGGTAIPTEPDGRAWVRYRWDHAVPRISAGDILSGLAGREAIEGRVVMVGSSAAGLGDIKTTPGGLSLPGVEVHAQLLETITSGDFLRRPATVAAGERLALLVVGLGLVWLGPTLRAGWLPVLLAATMAVAAVVTWASFTQAGLLVDGGYVGVALGIVLFWLAMAKFIREEAQRRTIRHAFGLYLSPVMVDKLAATRGTLKLGGERRELTIMLADIRSFTPLAERFTDDPEGLTQLLNRYFTVMTDAVQGQGGTIDKYIGDAIMAFWNAPLADPRHAARACEAALEMRRRLALLNAELAAEHGSHAEEPFEPLRFGVGINTGRCFVGNLGSAQRFNYSVIGDPVNIAARLEGSSKTYGIDIILGASARDAAGEVAALELDLVRLHGRRQATRIYGLMGDADLARDPAFVELARNHAAMLEAYRARDWDQAEAHLAATREVGIGHGLDRFHNLYAARITRLRADPPSPGWDGSELAEGKG